MVRVDGQLRPLANTTALSAEAAEKIIAEITTDEQWAQLAKTGEVDFACEIPGLARFRVNVYRQQRGIDAVFRIIPLRAADARGARLAGALVAPDGLPHRHGAVHRARRAAASRRRWRRCSARWRRTAPTTC